MVIACPFTPHLLPTPTPSTPPSAPPHLETREGVAGEAEVARRAVPPYPRWASVFGHPAPQQQQKGVPIPPLVYR
ncbi:hypothetical protein ES705_26789 [subsurface metagenome]